MPSRSFLYLIFFLCGMPVALAAQELYIYADPASNLPARVLSLRLTSTLMPMEYGDRHSVRINPEAGVGISKNLQAKVHAYGSNMFQQVFLFEGLGLSAKYRFLSVDDLHKHFRMAAFAKATWIKNPSAMADEEIHQRPDGSIHQVTSYHYATEIAIDGNHSGWQTGITATQLVHKLAISGTLMYQQRWNNGGSGEAFPASLPGEGLQYSLSAGMLIFPRSYTSYRQTNLNVYLDILGSTVFDNGGNYLDVAPGLQLIMNSTSRLDLAYRFQASGSMKRYNETQWLLRYEYNLLNFFSKKK